MTEHRNGNGWEHNGFLTLPPAARRLNMSAFSETRDPKSAMNIWALPLDKAASPAIRSFRPFSTSTGQFSRDGKWIAYQSDESGRHEIYLRPFPGPAMNGPFPRMVALKYVGDMMERKSSTSHWMVGSWPCRSEWRRTPLPRSRCTRSVVRLGFTNREHSIWRDDALTGDQEVRLGLHPTHDCRVVRLCR